MHDIIVLKCGGSTISELSDQFFANISRLQEAGLKPVIVHGGGPVIEEMLTKLNIETEFIDGLRKTSEEMMDVVEMVLSGTVNQFFTRRLNEANIRAIGLSGSDAQLIQAEPIDLQRYGLVGKVNDVNSTIIHKLIDLGIVPVISPIGVSKDGSILNINADTAAGAIATALNAKQLVFVTDVPGIIHDNKLLKTVTDLELKQLIKTGVVHGGMIPKVKAAMSSLTNEMKEVMIIDGKQSTLASDTKFVGTIIKKTIEVL